MPMPPFVRLPNSISQCGPDSYLKPHKSFSPRIQFSLWAFFRWPDFVPGERRPQQRSFSLGNGKKGGERWTAEPFDFLVGKALRVLGSPNYKRMENEIQTSLGLGDLSRFDHGQICFSSMDT